MIKKQEILMQSYKDLLFIGSYDIFNIEVYGALSIHVIVHNSLTQNQNRLKFGI